MRVPMHTKSVLTDYTRTLHLRELDIKTRRIMSLAYKFSSKTLHLVDASCINLYWHEAHAALWQGTRTERSSQASRCPAIGTCVILLSSAASRLTALTLFCTSQSCLNKLGFHSNCLSVKLHLGTAETHSTNKGPSISYSTCQSRIKFLIS